MQDEHTQPQHPTAPTDATPAPATPGTHTYHAPTLTNFGSLVELVQRNPGSGRDGGSGDCTLS